MRTTALIVEFLVTGVAYLVSIIALVWKILPFQEVIEPIYVGTLSDLGLIFFITAGAIAYLFGFIMNFGAYQLLRPLESKAYHRHFSGDDEFRRVEAEILHHPMQAHQYQFITTELSFLRLSRAASLVSLILALASLLNGLWLWALLLFGFFLVGLWSVFFRADRYFAIVAGTYSAISSQDTPSVADEPTS